MKQYKVGLIGAGGVTELHLEGYKAHPERIQIEAICDPNETLLNQKAEQYQIPKRYTSIEEFIANSEVDIAIVCTPTSIRKQVVFPLLEAGFPLFVEKPFSDTLVEAQEITDKAKSLNIPIAVNQNFRLHFPFYLVKELVKNNRIGKVNSMIFNNFFFRQDQGWRTQCERNAISVMGIHWIDGFRQVLGEEATAVSSLMTSSNSIQCVGETDSHVQVEFETGAIASYTQSFSSAFNRTELIVIGETGTLHCEHGAVHLYEVGNRTAVDSFSNDLSREYATFDGLNQLIDWIETGKESANSANDNLKTVAILDAAYRSKVENRRIELHQGVIQ
ncbi:Gfo/Idh/MocA family protein [Paenibacillus endoradicis]|uniref:Gfo/Idh/MocA family protein n=1 Tax=Paenibacillus endoradicis TaxID=2972487 RepID=UPI002158F4E3|nr:Gfo/Idh/MocA family oxidoreductase [Paenibacillus endoradicis]MCR8656553.1 Gfo/Idh/MocA family oxidoreductase [Paenibacillus endoradicis]